ncbi:HNH endonuclease [Falsiroseomonas sp. HC035]|uniref:HNH endonuclease n=1 Tax=Falsiroseomonas sp. HC035 TaxID=3390999 RepID=UPI003D313772
MANLAALTDPNAVLQAIRELDDLGREAFLAKYGYGEAREFWLLHNGERYDSKAIVGVAFKYQKGIGQALDREDFSGGSATVQKALERLGFEVEVDGVRSGKPRTNRKAIEPEDGDTEPFDPKNARDARKRVLRAIKARRGQPQFRKKLIDVYQGRCAVTGCDVVDILEAAHITPYLGPQTNHVTNGLLLRTDLHTLFDAGLIAVEPKTKEVLVAATIKDPVYRALHGRLLRKTKTEASAPSEKALKQHRADCGW